MTDPESRVGANHDNPSAGERLPRYRRDKTVACAVTTRDLEILRIVSVFRLVSSEHLQLLVAGSAQGILRRLQRLFHAGYLERIRPQFVWGGGSKKMVYALTNKGVQTLHKEGLIQNAAKTDLNAQNRDLHDPFIEHRLLVSHVRAVLTAACANHPEFKLITWREGREITDTIEVRLPSPYAKLPVAADGFFSIRDAQGRTHYFLEADRGTMNVERFIRKLIAYAAYQQAERHKEKYGIKHFRVLTVTSSNTRLENFVRAVGRTQSLRRAPSTMFLFTTEAKLSLSRPETIFEKIWTRPGAAEPCSILGDGAAQKSNTKGETETMSSTRPNEARRG